MRARVLVRACLQDDGKWLENRWEMSKMDGKLREDVWKMHVCMCASPKSGNVGKFMLLLSLLPALPSLQEL